MRQQDEVGEVTAVELAGAQINAMMGKKTAGGRCFQIKALPESRN